MTRLALAVAVLLLLSVPADAVQKKFFGFVQGKPASICSNGILLEQGGNVLLEQGGRMLSEQCCPVTSHRVLLEQGGAMLLEQGGYALTEQ